MKSPGHSEMKLPGSDASLAGSFLALGSNAVNLWNSASKPRGKCRWPIYQPGARDFAFCGSDSIEGFSYCACHVRMTYRFQGPIGVSAEAAVKAGPFRHHGADTGPGSARASSKGVFSFSRRGSGLLQASEQQLSGSRSISSRNSLWDGRGRVRQQHALHRPTSASLNQQQKSSKRCEDTRSRDHNDSFSSCDGVLRRRARNSRFR